MRSNPETTALVGSEAAVVPSPYSAAAAAVHPHTALQRGDEVDPPVVLGVISNGDHTGEFHAGICDNFCPPVCSCDSPSEFGCGPWCSVVLFYHFVYARIRGREFGDSYWLHFCVWLPLFLVMNYIVLASISIGITPTTEWQEKNFPHATVFMHVANVIFAVLLAGVRARFRQKYAITTYDESCCGCSCEDLCCSTFCTHCVICQMLQHSNKAQNIHSSSMNRL
jgi:hypothetical protein